MAEYVTPPPEHDHVEAWLATIHEVNPASPYELAQLRTEMREPDPEWTDEEKQQREARLAELGVAQKAVQSLVTEYLPLTDRYERPTATDPTPFENIDRAQTAREALVRAAWQYRVGMTKAGRIPLTFSDYAKKQIEHAVYEWKVSREGRFFELPASKARRVKDDARRSGHLESRQAEIDRYVEVRNGLPTEELAPEDMVTTADPTFDAGAAADLLRVYQAVSATWLPEQKNVVGTAWALLGGVPYHSFRELGEDTGTSASAGHIYMQTATAALRRYDNAERFTGYVTDEAIVTSRETPQIRGKAVDPNSPLPIPQSFKSRTREVTAERNETFEQAVAGLGEALAQPGYFAQTHPQKLDIYEATRAILQACPGVAPKHMEAVWNRSIEDLVVGMQRQLGRKFELWRVGQLFSNLLAATMGSRDIVRLHIPPSLSGKMDFIGAGLLHGTLFVKGDVGECAGINTGPDATIRIEGRAGSRMGIGGVGIVTALSTADRGRPRF